MHQKHGIRSIPATEAVNVVCFYIGNVVEDVIVSFEYLLIVLVFLQ